MKTIFIAFLCVLFGSIWADNSENGNRFLIFENPNASYEEKRAVVEKTTSVSEEDLKYIHLLLEKGIRITGLSPIKVLIKVKDKSSVPIIGKMLLSEDNRYYALALGGLGYKEGIPYLRQAIKQSKYPFVIEDCWAALRTLGEKRETVDLIPPQTENKPILVNISSSSNDIYIDDNFSLELNFKNTSEKDIRIASSCFRFLKLSSPDKEIILDVLTAFVTLADKNITEKYILLKPKESFNHKITFLFKLDKSRIDVWTEPQTQPEKVFLLDMLDTSSAYELGLYEEGKSFDIDFAIVYDPEWDKKHLSMYEKQQPEEYKKLGGVSIYLDTIVSNTVRIHFHGTKRK